MPAFPTPTPIDLAINLQVGRLEVIAGDRTDTVVTVTPSNPAKEIDIRGAADTRVVFDGQLLTITGPKPRFSFVGPWESIDLTVELPTGSRLTADVAMGGVRTTGTLGATRIKASTGTVDVDSTADLWLRAGHGNSTVGTVGGSAEITADHGQIRLGAVTGNAILKASHGSITVTRADGELEAKLSYGDLEITRALGSVAAKTAYGSITLGEVSSGSIRAESAYGDVTVGVLPGIAAWLDLASKNGYLRNELDGEGAPDPSEQTVSVRARTQASTITIRRARKDAR